MQKLGSFTKERSEFFCNSNPATSMKSVFVLIATFVLISSSHDSGSRFHFLDATIESGLASFRHVSGNPRDKRYILEVMSGGVAIFDYDNDGLPDVYLVNGSTLDALRGKAKPDPNAKSRLYHNLGNGKFEDVTDRAGVGNFGRWGMGACAADYDNDGRTDLFVTNAFSRNVLYHNNGNGTFKDIGFDAGAAVNEDGREQASMGVDAGDYDGDGYFDIFTTNFVDDYSTLYHNEGGKQFSDVSNPAGLAAPGWNFLKWGTGFVDFDNDGRPDIFVANGHIYPEIEGKGFGQTHGQRNQLFENLGDGHFSEVREETLEKIMKVSRGAAFADLDGDGRVDIVINNLDDQPTVLLNRSVSGNWIELKLVGRTSNRDAIGARVTITEAGKKQVAEIKAGHSYLSQSDLRLHFGLGVAKKIDAIEIRWPRAGLQKLSNVTPNQVLRIDEQTTERQRPSSVSGSAPR